MFAAHCLFSRTLPENLAAGSGNGTVFFQDCGKLEKERTSISTVQDRYQ
jgi:hypothetical protein